MGHCILALMIPISLVINAKMAKLAKQIREASTEEMVSVPDTSQVVDTTQVKLVKPEPFNADAFKYGILFPENGGKRNYQAMNPQSTATGAYQILFSQAENWLPSHGYGSIKTRKDFANSPEAQEAYMDARVDTYVNKHAADLTKEYKPQLGDKWEYSTADVAALVHFLGRQGTRFYFGALRDGKDPISVLPSHVANLPPDEYLRRFREGYNSYGK